MTFPHRFAFLKTVTASVCLALGPAAPAAVASLERTLPAGPDGPVVLAARPDPGVTAWAVEEQLPSGTVAVAISHGGGFDPYTHKVKWGPFTDSLQRDLAYRMVSPASIEAVLAGRVSWDGQAPLAAGGPDAFTVEGDSFSSWLVATFGGDIFGRPEADPQFDGDGDGIPLLAEYYFGLDPNAPDKPGMQLSINPQNQLRLSLVRRASITGLTAAYWRSADLQEWMSFEPGSPVEASVDGELETLVFAFGEFAGATYVKIHIGR